MTPPYILHLVSPDYFHINWTLINLEISSRHTFMPLTLSILSAMGGSPWELVMYEPTDYWFISWDLQLRDFDNMVCGFFYVAPSKGESMVTISSHQLPSWDICKRSPEIAFKGYVFEANYWHYELAQQKWSEPARRSCSPTRPPRPNPHCGWPRGRPRCKFCASETFNFQISPKLVSHRFSHPEL